MKRKNKIRNLFVIVINGLLVKMAYYTLRVSNVIRTSTNHWEKFKFRFGIIATLGRFRDVDLSIAKLIGYIAFLLLYFFKINYKSDGNLQNISNTCNLCCTPSDDGSSQIVRIYFAIFHEINREFDRVKNDIFRQLYNKLYKKKDINEKRYNGL